MAKAVAVSGDASATAASATAPADKPAWQGSWSAGSITETAHAQLKVDGLATLREVRCSFSFTGNDTSVAPSPPPVSATSDVVLTASSTVLREGGQFVLLDGDSARDMHGNEVSVQAGGHLSTA